jgi:cytoskeleton protein RodZ
LVEQQAKIKDRPTVAVENQDLGEPAPSGVTTGVGSLLRETRERRGQDLVFVANALRIRQPYLQAIEDGRSEDLPGSTYAVGFVRGYAEYLGLDSKEIVRRFRQENGEFTNRAELVFPSAVSEGSIPTGALLGFAILAAAAAYGAWYWYQSRDPSVASAVPALPERLAALIHHPLGSGSELVPVDGSKVDEVPQPPLAAPAPATTPAFPTTAAPSGPGSAPPVNPAHEDVVPPSDDDTSATPSPQASPTTPPAVAADTPPSENKPVDVKPQDAKPGRDLKGKAGARSSEAAGSTAEPPADAAVTPLSSETPSAVATGEDAAKPDSGKPSRKAKGKDAKAGTAKTPANPTDTESPSSAAATDGQPVEAPQDTQLAEVKPATVASSSRIVLRAKEDCWIEIRDRSGKVVQKRLLRKGDSYSAPTRPGLTMTVGNAGALTMMVDGKATGSLGRIGMVRHDVPLDAERLKNGVEPPTDPLAEPGVPANPPAGGTPGTE